MKNLYLDYNSLLNNFVFGEGKSHTGRRIIKRFDKKEVFDVLENVDIYRKTNLYLSSIPQNIEKQVMNIFKGTKIIVRDLEKGI